MRREHGGGRGAACAAGMRTVSPGCSMTQFPHCIRVFSVILPWVQSVLSTIQQLMGVPGQGPPRLLVFRVCISRCWGTEEGSGCHGCP